MKLSRVVGGVGLALGTDNDVEHTPGHAIIKHRTRLMSRGVRCPTGVATQDPWLAHGLDPASKSERCAQNVRTFRKELVMVSESVGVAHPGLIRAEDVDIFRGDYSRVRSTGNLHPYRRTGRVLFECDSGSPASWSRKVVAQWETSFSATVLRIARIRRVRSLGWAS